MVHIQVESTVRAAQEYQEFFNNPFFERFFGPQFRSRTHSSRANVSNRAPAPASSSATEGHILTNNHVVENADKITVTLSDNRKSRPNSSAAIRSRMSL